MSEENRYRPDPPSGLAFGSSNKGGHAGFGPPTLTDRTKLLIASAALVVMAVLAAGIGMARRTDQSVAAPAAPAGGAGGLTSGAEARNTPGAGATSTTAAPAEPGTSCAAWPATASRSPDRLLADDVILWDYFGWHLRVRDAKAAKTYSGTITATGPINPADFTMIPAAQGAARGSVKVSGNTATFTLNASDAENGFDFKFDCRTARFAVAISVNGAPVAADKVRIGQKSTATANPVEFVRE